VASWIVVLSVLVPIGVTADSTSSAPQSQPQMAVKPLAIVASPDFDPTNQPFYIPHHTDDYLGAKMALQWLPEIKTAVGDAINWGVLNPGERQLWENILLGQVGLESVGQAFIVPNSGSRSYSQGLTQLTYPALYAEENPFDPLTNMRAVLRTTVRYYRHWGNRWDRALSQYLTGSADESQQRYSADNFGTTGEMYVQRIVNIVWEAARLQQAGDLYPPRDNDLQASCGGETCWYDHAPPWNLWDSPALPFNWLPPSTDTAYWYIQDGDDANIDGPIATATWDAIPTWFYSLSPAPDVPMYLPRAPTVTELQQYPLGATTLTAPYRETYPRRKWTAGNP
jgi:hypothetical protein